MIYSTKLPINKNVLLETIHFWQTRKIGPNKFIHDCTTNGVLIIFQVDTSTPSPVDADPMTQHDLLVPR